MLACSLAGLFALAGVVLFTGAVVVWLLAAARTGANPSARVASLEPAIAPLPQPLDGRKPQGVGPPEAAPAAKDPAPDSVTLEELQGGEWHDSVLTYKFNPNKTYYQIPNGQRDQPVTVIGTVTIDNRQWGTYSYADGALKMTPNGGLILMGAPARLTWQERPNLILVDRGGFNGRTFWERVRRESN